MGEWEVDVTDAGLVTLGVLVAGVFLIFVSGRQTDRRRIRSRGCVRLWRAYRTMWWQILLLPLGWPHFADLLMGTHRLRPQGVGSVGVWSQASVTLRLAKHSGRRRGEPILLVHSILTQPWILDLAPSHSVVEFLVGLGRDVYVLDWGDPTARDAKRSLADLDRILREAETFVLSHARARRLHLVGYCFGGTICLARAAARPDKHIASIVAIAAPIDFAVPSRLRTFMTHRLLRPASLLDADGCVPAAVVREAFHALRPQALRSVLMGIRSRHDESFRRFYASMTQWAWSQRRLGGGLFFDLVDLYRENGLIRGKLELDGATVNLADIKTPVLIAAANRDHIVPVGSSLGLLDTSKKSVEFVTVAGGHVSMLVGSGARTVLWPALSGWLNRKFVSRSASKAKVRAGAGVN